VDGQRRRLDDVTGDGYAVLVVGPPDLRLVSACRDLGATMVRVVAVPSPDEHPWCTVAVDEDGHLLGWMRRARAGAVLLRPDHVVQDIEPLTAARHGVGGRLAARIRTWADELHWVSEPRWVAQPAAREDLPIFSRSSTDGGTP
jgi:3-(3-hydroxy-phenyl)propionate hydroxylase